MDNHAAVINKYVNLLATATQQNVMLEVEVDRLNAENAKLKADAPVEGNVVE